MSKDLNAMNVGTQRSANVNNPNPRPIGARSSFPDNAHRHATTLQYGHIGVFDHFNTVRHDELNFRNQHEIHSYTLSSPLMSGVTINKTYVRVPYKAIYPKNWDIMLPLPTKGDDVPESTRCVLSSLFFEKIDSYFDSVVAAGQTIDVVDSSSADKIKSIIDFTFLLESIYSTGSIFSQLNLNTHALFEGTVDGQRYDFDDFFDLYFVPFIQSFSDKIGFQFQDFGGVIFSVGDSFQSLDGQGFQSQNWFVPLGYLISLLRHYDYTVVRRDNQQSSFDNPYYKFDNELTSFYLVNPGPLNIESVAAYQLACYQFFTNEHIDFIYSADLFRRALISQYYNAFDPDRLPVFGWNGELFEYDVLSQGTFDSILRSWDADLSFEDYTRDLFCIEFFRNIFSVNQSLRYGDYFTGARPQPLAVGDYSVEVVNGSVDTLDQVRGMQLVRLANNANLAGSKVGNYLQALWGGDLPEAPDDIPTFLVHQSFGVKGFEVENTGDAQVSDQNQIAVTTQLRTTDNKHVFQYFEDRDYSIILGLVSFDCERFYSNTCDRFAFHYDRYDDFIPEMQYLGDQPIFARELDIRNSQLAPVAYTVRNMEYKQKYSHASGGFIKRLPSWLFVADNETGIPMIGNISPSYIRSIPAEFDRFYKSLTGYSLGTRFHFIVKFSNVDHATRQMVYQPQILK